MSRLSTSLLRRARSWAGQLTTIAKSLAPNHVKAAIHSHVEERGEDTFIIRIMADRKMAPDARAQEYGSGLHARRGEKKKYLIRPKNKKVLAFYWDVLDDPDGIDRVFNSPKFAGFTPDGRGMFRYVEHPGIEAANSGKGYIAPAMIELRKRARAELTKDVRDAILGDLRASFGRKSK